MLYGTLDQQRNVTRRGFKSQADLGGLIGESLDFFTAIYHRVYGNSPVHARGNALGAVEMFGPFGGDQVQHPPHPSALVRLKIGDAALTATNRQIEA